MVKEVVGEQGTTVSQSRLLSQGEVFAYREMLTKSKHNKTTRACGHTELMALSIDDLLDVLREFPDVYERVYVHAQEKYNCAI